MILQENITELQKVREVIKRKADEARKAKEEKKKEELANKKKPRRA